MKKILVTGGFGKIGKHFILNAADNYKIRVADIKTDSKTFSNHIEIIQADLTQLENCIDACQNIDIIIHLAGIIDDVSESDEMFDTNLMLNRNIFKAAKIANCKKVIFASSAQTIESYPTDLQINKDQIVKPRNIYGVAKCFGEALAAYYAYQNNISSICLRIGAYEFPEDHTEMSFRDLSAYSNPDDINQLISKCIEVENIQFEVFNAISNNRYKRLDITEAQEKLDYHPKADAFELFTPSIST